MTVTRVDALRAVLRDTQPPSLRRVNGFGNIVGGRYSDPDIAPLFFIACVPTLLFIPIGRGNIYLVAEKPAGVFRFYGVLFWEDFERIYPDGPAKIRSGTVTEAVVSFASVVIVLVVMAFIFSGLHQLFR